MTGKNTRSTINLDKEDKEQYIDKAVPRIIGRTGAILSQQEAMTQVYDDWWIIENARDICPDKVNEIFDIVMKERPNKDERMPWNLPPADLDKR